MKRKKTIIINDELKDKLFEQLHDLQQHEIRWDRVIEDPEFIYVYGWIANEKHERGDFVLLTLDLDKRDISIITSSVLLSKKLRDSFLENTDCIKFTEYFQNQIKK